MSLKYLKIRKISILFFLVFLSCKVTDNYTGVWVSTDSYLYKNTKVEFFDNNRVIMSNLPQNGYIDISSNPQDAFDSSIKSNIILSFNKATTLQFLELIKFVIINF